MKKNLLFIFVFSFVSIFIIGCSNSSEQSPYDTELSEYLIASKAEYYGEGQYYHEIQELQITDENFKRIVIAKGEIRDTSIGKRTDKFKFVYEFIVDKEKIIQTIDNKLLNDSEYKKIVLLKAPIELGNSWSFDAIGFDNKRERFTAEIISCSDDKDEITVKYYASNNYTEYRTFIKNLGVVRFNKEIKYKDARTISGFNMNDILMSKNEADDKNRSLEAYLEVVAPEIILELLINFNTEYAKRVRGEENSINYYMTAEGAANEKISGMSSVATEDFKFSALVVTELLSISENIIEVEVAEKYDVGKEDFIINRMKYRCILKDDIWLIDDFSSL